MHLVLWLSVWKSFYGHNFQESAVQEGHHNIKQTTIHFNSHIESLKQKELNTQAILFPTSQ